MMSSTSDAQTRRAGLELLAASFAVLFLELALIRWLPVRVRVAGYFPNLTLLGAFLGLGVGALLARRRSLLWMWPGAALVLVLVAWALSGIAFTSNGVTEHLWLLYADLGEGAPLVDGIRLPLVILFVLVAASFVPLGQFVGTRLEAFRAQARTLSGYAFDLGGSLLGVVAFALAAAAGVKPVVWFAPALLAGLVVVERSRRGWITFGVGAVAILAVVQVTTGNEKFSPYYALEAVPGGADGAVTIRANGSAHQDAIDVISERGDRRRLTSVVGYRYPYVALGRPIRKALVLGAGTGNDVAVLLQQGAAEIHAVEIDPQIIALGRELHPNNPYADPRVTVHNTDARSFLNETDETFDVITFGTLDSMTRLSALSNVRLDNFVYTREAIEAARARLTPDGGLILYFMIGHQYIADHLTALLASTFGAYPQLHRGNYAMFNAVFMVGPAFAPADAPGDPSLWQSEAARALLPSDDWPYLYLPERGINAFYLSMMVILAGLAALTILAVSPEMRGSLRGGRGIDLEMFLYGFAFLLIETKFVTAMNLLWGATWITSAVVFGSILGVILVGTLLTDRKPIPFPAAGAGLIAALLVAYFMPLQLLLSSSTALRLILSVLLVGTPVLFASFCFAERFKAKPAADLAFGWNLLGAVLGGLTEFFSMTLGFRALTLVAVAAYLGALLIGQRAIRGSESRLSDTSLPAGPGSGALVDA